MRNKLGKNQLQNPGAEDRSQRSIILPKKYSAKISQILRKIIASTKWQDMDVISGKLDDTEVMKMYTLKKFLYSAGEFLKKIPSVNSITKNRIINKRTSF